MTGIPLYYKSSTHSLFFLLTNKRFWNFEGHESRRVFRILTPLQSTKREYGTPRSPVVQSHQWSKEENGTRIKGRGNRYYPFNLESRRTWGSEQRRTWVWCTESDERMTCQHRTTSTEAWYWWTETTSSTSTNSYGSYYVDPCWTGSTTPTFRGRGSIRWPGTSGRERTLGVSVILPGG